MVDISLITESEIELRKIKGYRYQIGKECVIPIVSKELKKALINIETVIHPFYQIYKDRVWVKDLYAWDGATGAVNTSDLIVPSLIHDIGCQAVNSKKIPFSLREYFDEEYYQQCLLYGVCKERAIIHYTIIKAWGKIPKDKDSDEYSKIYEVEILGF